MTITALVTGHVVTPAKIGTSAKGTPYARILVRSGDGEQAIFVQAMIFDDDSITAVESLAKGDGIAVSGTLQIAPYQAKDGRHRSHRLHPVQRKSAFCHEAEEAAGGEVQETRKSRSIRRPPRRRRASLLAFPKAYREAPPPGRKAINPKETTTMLTTNTDTTTTATNLAEQAGGEIAQDMLNAIFDANDQAEAFRAVKVALGRAFDISHPINEAIAGGFAVRIVNVLERGRDAILADGPHE